MLCYDSVMHLCTFCNRRTINVRYDDDDDDDDDDDVQEMFESNDSLDVRIRSLLEQGEQRIARSTPSDVTTLLRQSLDDVSACWDTLKLRFIERGNQLTAACDEAKQLNDRLTEIMSWLNGAEQTLSSLQPVSRVIDSIQLQIQQHHVTSLIYLSHFLHSVFD